MRVCADRGGSEAMKQKPKVLCVDDEEEVLEGIKMHLRKHFRVTTETRATKALELLREDSEYAAVLSDMRMPEMNGAEFLRECQGVVPDATRLLLTGYSEMEAAIDAVNDGQIFRFLTKPCPPKVLLSALSAATDHHHLLRAERDLLQNTVRGSIDVLTEVLSLAAPTAFSRTSFLKAYVTHMACRLGLTELWIYELSANLAQIGCITLPPETLHRVLAGQELSDAERSMFDAHPETGHRLLGNVPRLEVVAEIVRRQSEAPTNWPDHPESTDEGKIAVGAAMLQVAIAVDMLVARGRSLPEAAATVRKSAPQQHRKLLDALSTLSGRQEQTETQQAVRICELRIDMTLGEDVLSAQGTTLCRKDQPLTAPLIERLKNFAAGEGVREPVRVRIPTFAAEPRSHKTNSGG